MVTASHLWFQKGAEMAGRVFSRQEAPFGYFCPLCTRLFEPDEASALSREDVPAKSLGGRAMCLTCRDCNSTAGHRLDIHARRREDNLEFAAGTMPEGRAITTRVKVGDAEVNAWVRSQGGEGASIVIMVSPTHNPPSAGDLMGDELRRLGADATLNLSLVGTRYRANEASTAMLRYAYLTAFSQLGYYYASGRSLDVVRRKISNPASEPHVFGVMQYDSPGTTRHFWIINEPEDLRSIAVQIGREVVFLPREREDSTFYDRFAARRRDGPIFEATFAATELTWPDAPRYILDEQLF